MKHKSPRRTIQTIKSINNARVTKTLETPSNQQTLLYHTAIKARPPPCLPGRRLKHKRGVLFIDSMGRCSVAGANQDSWCSLPHSQQIYCNGRATIPQTINMFSTRLRMPDSRTTRQLYLYCLCHIKLLECCPVIAGSVFGSLLLCKLCIYLFVGIVWLVIQCELVSSIACALEFFFNVV